jgi:hypothetical protein
MSPTENRPVRAHVVYESMFGNTEKVARAVAEELGAAGLDVSVAEVSEAPAAHDLATDLLVLGAPTHAFSLSRANTREDAVRQGAPRSRSTVGLRDWLSVAHDEPPAGHVLTAAFDTRVSKVRHLPGSAAKKATRLARGARLDPALGSESFFVDDVQGPLLEGELDRARKWGRHLAEQVSTGPARE